jgi:hypothetical protein
MTTDEIEAAFAKAGYEITMNDLVPSRDTLEDFVGTWGPPDFGKAGVSVWWSIQTRPHAARGDLCVLTTDRGTISYFSGDE